MEAQNFSEVKTMTHLIQ